jgi:hypothetical protein
MPAGVATISDCLFLRCKQESVRSQGFSSSDMRRELSRPLNGYVPAGLAFKVLAPAGAVR